MFAARSGGHPWPVVDALVPITRSAPPISLAAARTALAQATELAAVVSVIDRLEVLRVAARKAKQSLDAQNDWATIKLEAERKAGRMLTDLRARGDLRPGRPNADTLSALSELSISQQQSSRCQRLAAVPDDRFTRWVEETRARDDEVTEAGLFAVATRIATNRAYGPLDITPVAAPGGVPRNVLLEGDCLAILRALPDACVDALVTDPPAAIGFMGAAWDSDRGSRQEWVAWMSEVMRECLRVLKPGAHGLVWALPRTSHWTAWALEEAGFEVRDQILHVFAAGFPKSLDVSKELDRRAGAEREIVGVNPNCRPGCTQDNTLYKSGFIGKVDHLTSPATDAARAWEGHGSGLKPAHEVWWLVRKPLSGPIVENVLRYGTGTLNIDGCRIPLAEGEDLRSDGDEEPLDTCATGWGFRRVARQGHLGRYPADVILSDRMFDGDYPDEVVGGGMSGPGNFPRKRGKSRFWAFSGGRKLDHHRVGEAGGKSRYFLLPRAEQAGLGSDPGASTPPLITEGEGNYPHLYLIPKASRKDRNGGVNGEIDLPAQVRVFNGQSETPAPSNAIEGSVNERFTTSPSANNHLTVKPVDLMRWLVRLIAPRGALVLDPFAGSGTTGVAAHFEGCDYLLIEQEPESVDIARARLGDSLSL